MNRTLRVLCAALIAASGVLLGAHQVSAHQVFTSGAYRVAIGWQTESPDGTDAYVGERNAIQIFVDEPVAGKEIGNPVSDLNGDCTKPDFQVTITVGTTTSSPYCPDSAYDADTQRGRPDEYDAPVTPTVPGTYTFHIFGTIHGAKVDQTIKSGPSTFASLIESTALDFPNSVPPLSAVSTKVDQVTRRADDAQTSAQSASSSANTATALAIAGIVAAVLFGGAGILIGMRRRKA